MLKILFGIILLIQFGYSVSEYDNRISKYDVRSDFFSYKINQEDDKLYCVSVSLVEKNFLQADIKSGKLRIIQDIKFKEVLHLSNHFESKEVYTYFRTKSRCEIYLDDLKRENYKYWRYRQ